MDFEKEFLVHPFNDKCFYKIFSNKFVIYLWGNPSVTMQSLKDCKSFYVRLFLYKEDEFNSLYKIPPIDNKYPTSNDWKSIGITSKEYPDIIFTEPAILSGCSNSIIEDIITKLNIAVGTTPIKHSSNEPNKCSKCNGTGIIDLGFYKRQCMDCNRD